MPLYRSKVYGIVQGVGFRPFVDRLAARFHILGSVCNKGPYVEIYAQGSSKAVASFLHAIKNQPPKRAAILKIDTERCNTTKHPYTAFTIIESAKERGDIFVSPDIATCDKCQAELFNKANRRYLHPFINCTACGPRLTILDSMPYDRERTSMGEFPMCPDCEAEYTDPDTRRYDAQPICCNACGPEVYILEDKSCRGPAAITRARQVIASGGIVAIKGIGGFHLACDAGNPQAISRLRKEKHRPVKPFAVMLRSMDTVRRECKLENGQEAILTGHQKPILLLRRKAAGKLCDLVAPGNPKVGVMLPYAPIQMLLFDYPDGITMPDMLIMTSGNPAGAPICRDDKNAAEALGGFTDLILSHNRRIRIRADDTVMDWLDDAPYMIRRSRGFAPLPFLLKNNLAGQVIGIGGELKNTFCIGANNLFYPSPYVGDMSDLHTVQALQETIGRLTELLEVKPTLVACDMHPRYHTTAIGRKLALPLFPVQHHYAHILSCMAENDYDQPVIGVSFDGTGYGTDGTIWGGEILQADFAGFTRLGHIQPFLQTGGDKASVEGWRIAVSLLYGFFHDKAKVSSIAKKLNLCEAKNLPAQFFMADNKVNAITSTSAGRLFDAVSALLGIRSCSTFEGEAAMYLEFAAQRWQEAAACRPTMPLLPAFIHPSKDNNAPFALATDQLFLYILHERLNSTDTAKLAWQFHQGLADMILAACKKARERTRIHTVALSGGVFQNLLLTKLVSDALKTNGFTVLRHSLIPPNDGGICLGQAVAAMWHLNHP